MNTIILDNRSSICRASSTALHAPANSLCANELHMNGFAGNPFFCDYSREVVVLHV